MKKGKAYVKEYTTGESHLKSELFQVKEDGKAAKYFFSEDAYKKWRYDADYFNKIKDYISFNLLGYQDSKSPFNSSLVKKIMEFKEIGFDAFYETLLRYESQIQLALKAKDFSGDYHRIAYIVAIVNGHIRDVKKGMIEREKREEYLDSVVGDVVEETEETAVHKPKKKRDWLED